MLHIISETHLRFTIQCHGRGSVKGSKVTFLVLVIMATLCITCYNDYKREYMNCSVIISTQSKNVSKNVPNNISKPLAMYKVIK